MQRDQAADDLGVLVRQRAGGGGLRGAVQRFGQLLGGDRLVGDVGAVLGGEGVGHHIALHLAHHAQMEHGGDGEGGGSLLPRRGGEGAADHLGLGEGDGVLGGVVQVDDLVEGHRLLHRLQLIARLAAVGQRHLDAALDHRLAGDDLDLVHLAHAGNVDDRLHLAGQGHLFLGGEQLIQVCHRAKPVHGDELLLCAAVRQGGDDLLLALGAHLRRQGIGPPHVHPALVHRAAVEVFHLAAHRDGITLVLALRQVHGTGERNFLLDLAKALVVLRLIVDDAPQIALHREAAGRHLLLQGDGIDKALDDLEDLRQIVRDEKFGLDGQLGFGLPQAAHGG